MVLKILIKTAQIFIKNQCWLNRISIKNEISKNWIRYILVIKENSGSEYFLKVLESQLNRSLTKNYIENICKKKKISGYFTFENQWSWWMKHENYGSLYVLTWIELNQWA